MKILQTFKPVESQIDYLDLWRDQDWLTLVEMYLKIS